MAYTNDTKPAVSTTYLLLENGGFLLQENGNKFILVSGGGYTNDTEPSASSWTNTTKPSAVSWTNDSK